MTLADGAELWAVSPADLLRLCEAATLHPLGVLWAVISCISFQIQCSP